jgi:tetratricopeptide (TPR) repeat protein
MRIGRIFGGWWLPLLMLLPAALAADTPTPSFSPDKDWIEIRSGGISVFTDGGEKSARRVAREFEQIRRVFEQGFPGRKIRSTKPLVVFAARNELTMKMLVPEYWSRDSAKPAGVYQTGGEARDYAIVRLDEAAPWDTHILYHEYVHALMHANFPMLPPWLDEGMAEFYASSSFGEKETVLGAANPRIPALRSQALLPLAVLLSATVDSPYYRDQSQASMFYAESWALVHYLMLGPGMENGGKMVEFLEMLQHGTEQEPALRQVFGGVASLETSLREDVKRDNLATRTIRNSASSVMPTKKLTTLSTGEIEGEVGNLRFWQHDDEDARRLLTQALRDDPHAAAAHEGLGLVLLRDHRNEAAAREFARASTLEGDRFLSIYYAAILAPTAFSNSASEQQRLDAALGKVLVLNPQFAPGYFDLARLRVRQVRLQEALVLAQRAVELEPSRSDYAELAAGIRGGLEKAAAASPNKKSD